MQSRPAPPARLERIGRYRIVRPLSKGGMALVYEARRESLAGVSPRVAIKLILPEHKDSQTFKELFINEARLGASMQHQNLVGIQDFDCEGDTYFLVMEFVEGFTLRRMIGLCQQHRIGIPLRVIAELGRQACDGLHYAHAAQDEKGRHIRLVHRDIKPSNLILNPQGVCKVLDFGISKGRLRKEREGSVKGTWGYMAPEQALGKEVFPPADVFGLGVVLFELAALRPMFQNKSKDEIRSLLADDHAARIAATLDPHYAPLIPVLVRALQHDTRARFQSAEAYGRALSALLPDPISARDEVVRFYEHLESLQGGQRSLPPSQATVATFGPSVVGARPSAPAVRSAGWFLSGAAFSGALVILVALVAIVAVLLYRDALVQPVKQVDVVRVQPDSTTQPNSQPVAPPDPQPQPVPDPVPQPDPEPVRVPVVRPVPVVAVPVPAPVPGPTPGPVETEPSEPDPVAVEQGTLQIDSVQRAEVYIQGQFVQFAPITQNLPPGKYSVSIIAMDGRRRTFDVNLKAGRTVKKNWDFDRMQWR